VHSEFLTQDTCPAARIVTDADPRNAATIIAHMDLILRNARVLGRTGSWDIGIEGGLIVAVLPNLGSAAREIDIEGQLITPSLIETHVHLDKSCLLERCKAETGGLDEAIREVAGMKAQFTAQDVHARARSTLERFIAHGVGYMRTHVEVDPVVGLRGFEGVLPLAREYRWALDLEFCVFPQEGLLNNPGTDELMVAALKGGATIVGGAPYTDSNPRGQIDRLFEMAREFDADIDLHLDFFSTAERMDIEYVCEVAERFRYGGRVAVGHMTTLSVLEPQRFEAIARRLADAGVAVTVLPSTDLYLTGRHQTHGVMRGVAPAHKLLQHGVNCSISTNNVLNPFTPFGDCSPIRIANLYANVAQVGRRDDMRACFDLVTAHAARLLRLKDYGLDVGRPADLLVFDAQSPEQVLAELVQPRYGFKRGRMTFSRAPVALHRP
jgi:cytosine deaminase